MQSDKVVYQVVSTEASRRPTQLRLQGFCATIFQLINRRKSRSLFLLAFFTLIMFIALNIVVPSDSWLTASRSVNYIHISTAYATNVTTDSADTSVTSKAKSSDSHTFSQKSSQPIKSSTLSNRTQSVKAQTQHLRATTSFISNSSSPKANFPTLATKIPSSVDYVSRTRTTTKAVKKLTSASSSKGTKFQQVSYATKPTRLHPTSTPAVDEEMACHFPKLDPFSKSIIHLVKKPAVVDCTESLPLLFNSTLNSTIVPADEIAEYYTDIESCCYWEVNRGHGSDDNDYSFSEDCHPLSLDGPTAITESDHEYVVISCIVTNNSTEATSNELDENSFQRDVDMHIFTPLKPKVEERVEAYYEKLGGTPDKSLEDERINVVILGIDAVSHMNFIRTMPKSYSYVLNNLSAVGMNGFNKVGDNTFPNVAALLTQLNTTEMKKCEKRKTFDKCPFVWKQYAKNGYRTSFVEDTPWMGAFNYLKKGFKTPPTDYYFRPFAVAAEKLVGTHSILNTRFCYGPRLAFEVVLDYIKKLAYSMGHHKRYFQFTWTSSLTHDYLNTPRLGDELLLSTLQWFNQEGYLNKTMLILMSDHGIRWGDIRDFLQGQLEERLPFLFFIAPTWFQQRYSRAFNNLKINQERLTTPFDLHATLVDLADLTQIAPGRLAQREMELAVSEKEDKLPRAISQFLPIPKSRTCEVAGIEEHYCTCHDSRTVQTSHPTVNQVANFAIFSINLIISEFPECSYLTLKNIKHAQEVRTRFTSAYQIAFTTSPGEAAFEASVIRNSDGYWQVSGSISRTNLYGNQSHCIEEKDVKLYCFCTDLIENAV